ncbi:hypothetical protein M0813_22223 [Anaeramoeba flamelloides]|uniref:Uncharacterized protein n=1 Tax=Anaeramoeba flamelloides TaxID=1746091 RepID=A0ABQ8YGR1_9EUKA|nr:hypothetical protein M0813_22223 [Anaeramoeba flamelloides]
MSIIIGMIIFKIISLLVLLVPSLMVIKRLVQQNKKGFDKSYHNFFYILIFVGGWGCIILLLVSIKKFDFKKYPPLLDVLYPIFLFISIYANQTIIVIQANLYYMCKLRNEKIAKKKTKIIFIVITILQIISCSFSPYWPNFLERGKTFQVIFYTAFTVFSIWPLYIAFYFFFKIKSVVKSVADEKIMKQIKKLLYVILVWLFFFILVIVFNHIYYFTNYPRTTFLLLLSGSFYFLASIPPTLCMVFLFRTPKYQSEQLLLSDSSSEIELSRD